MSAFIKNKDLREIPFHMNSPATIYFKEEVLNRIESGTRLYISSELISDVLKNDLWKREVSFIVVILNKHIFYLLMIFNSFIVAFEYTL